MIRGRVRPGDVVRQHDGVERVVESMDRVDGQPVVYFAHDPQSDGDWCLASECSNAPDSLALRFLIPHHAAWAVSAARTTVTTAPWNIVILVPTSARDPGLPAAVKMTHLTAQMRICALAMNAT